LNKTFTLNELTIILCVIWSINFFITSFDIEKDRDFFRSRTYELSAENDRLKSPPQMCERPIYFCEQKSGKNTYLLNDESIQQCVRISLETCKLVDSYKGTK
jgi:hypothetical protein